MKKKSISFRLDEDLHEFIQKYAQSRRMTLTQVLVNLILEFYQKEGKDLCNRNQVVSLVSESTKEEK